MPRSRKTPKAARPNPNKSKKPLTVLAVISGVGIVATILDMIVRITGWVDGILAIWEVFK